MGFSNVVVIDVVEIVLDRLKSRSPSFPKKNVVLEDFFKHEGQYDLIIEQTFFSSISPNLRQAYANKVCELLKPKGKLSGVLFDFEMDSGPPFGGTKQEYKNYFKNTFNILTMETCYNSNETWRDIELFFIVEKK
jgi:thiopurine S-methyltransferase